MARDPDLITLAEAAERLGVKSIKTVQRRLAEAQICGPRLGRAMMLTEADYALLKEAIRARRPRWMKPPLPAPPAPRRRARHGAETQAALAQVRAEHRQSRGDNVVDLDRGR